MSGKPEGFAGLPERHQATSGNGKLSYSDVNEISQLRFENARLTARIEQLEKANAKLAAFARRFISIAEKAELGDADQCRLCDGVGEVATFNNEYIECPDCIVRGNADIARTTLEASERGGE